MNMTKLGMVPMAGLLLISLGVTAGEKFTVPVQIIDIPNTNDVRLMGSMGSTRNTGSNTELLYCGGTSTTVSCAGRDATGRTIQCVSADSTFVDLFGGLTSDSFVNILIRGTDCLGMIRAESSAFEPRLP